MPKSSTAPPGGRAAEIPAVNGHSTARAVAGFYHALATHALLSPGLLAEAVSPQCSGPDRVFGRRTRRADALENAQRSCLGLPPLPAGR